MTSRGKRLIKLSSGHARAAGHADVCLALGPPIPGELDAHAFKIESDEYLVFSFPGPMTGPDREGGAALTQAERGIVRQILEGLSNSHIARSRGTSPRTIANQITTIYRKLGVRSRRELAASRYVPMSSAR